jgi:bis(5'-nucleosyl)-tetraphosphatase (symmetrical)
LAIYVIGDVQGCFTALNGLLEKLVFDRDSDQLWFAGDLVNRGPESLSCLRLIKELGPAARVVLGNHDLHLLATYFGGREPKRKDTLDSVINAPDVAELMHWLKQQPLMIWDQERDLAVTHAGIPHIWSVAQAFKLGQEVETILQSDRYAEYFSTMYGNTPDVWTQSLKGMDRLRVITNYFTRMRFIDRNGVLNLSVKESADSAPSGFMPWFGIPRTDQTRILFGHWAALEGVTNDSQFQALDTGCVWGGALTAINLDSMQRISCDEHGK